AELLLIVTPMSGLRPTL
ncbi:hypothetical protein MKD33_05560, partial [Chromobacterium piscinae]